MSPFLKKEPAVVRCNQSRGLISEIYNPQNRFENYSLNLDKNASNQLTPLWPFPN